MSVLIFFFNSSTQQNFTQKFSGLLVFLLIVFPFSLSAKSIINVDQVKKTDPISDSIVAQSNVEKTIFYVGEGVTVFAMPHFNANVEVIVEVSTNKKIQTKRAEKKNAIAVQSEQKKIKEKAYKNNVGKVFYENIVSNTAQLFSLDSVSHTGFSPTHDQNFYTDNASYYLLQLKQYDVIFISYKSAFSRVQYHHHLSVRPPPVFV